MMRLRQQLAQGISLPKAAKALGNAQTVSPSPMQSTMPTRVPVPRRYPLQKANNMNPNPLGSDQEPTA